MEIFTFNQGKYSCQVYKLAEESCPWVYTIAEPEDAEELVKALLGQKLVLVTIAGITWEEELSPWPAVKSFHGGQDFTGGADSFIQLVAEQIVPQVEQRLGLIPKYRVVAGYSLAGLWSLYTLYKTASFQRVVCASGSLWYDGFLAYMQSHQMKKLPEKVYFSLGEKEKNTKNKRLAVVEERTYEAENLLHQKGVSTVFEKNQGGHFQDTTERLARGIRWVIR